MTEPRQCFGNGLINPFFNTKKYTISCGKCGHMWKVKTSTLQDKCIKKCPCCNEINEWTHSAFFKHYEEQMN